MVTVQLASIPDRADMMIKTVKSLYLQDTVCNIRVMLNNYPDCFMTPPLPGVEFIDRNNEKGDAEKFYGFNKVKGYIFTCDDDLIYPPDYVSTMIRFLKEHGDKVIATCHGRVMNPKPVTTSYGDRKAAYHWIREVNETVHLDIGGTGVMAWHSDYFFPDYKKITKKNMADIWIHGFAKQQGCSIMLCPHPGDWIKYQNPKNTIWDEHYPNPKEQTDLYNSF